MNNIFQGFSDEAQCVRAWDRKLREQEWVDTTDVQAVIGYAAEDSTRKFSLDKAIKDAKGKLRKELLRQGYCFREKSDGADRRVVHTAYPIENQDPLHNLRISAIVEDALNYHRVLRLIYTPSFNREEEHLFHPQYLREYNGRPYVFGEYENKEEQGAWPFMGLAIDRIISAVPDKSVKYRQREPEYFLEMMKDTLSATYNPHYLDVYDVRIRTHTPKIHMLLMMNKLHISQREIMECTAEHPGEISLQLRYSIELLGKLLYYGGEIEVLSPDLLRDRIAGAAQMMARRYQ